VTTELSKRAQADLENIWQYGAERWSIDRSDAYQRELADTLGRCADYPEIGVAQPAFGKNVRTIVSGSHIVFYRPVKGGIYVIRILHQMQDGKHHLLK
jgi:toxin ParE1/3/4